MSKTAKELILSLPERIKPEAVGDNETTFHFVISGEGGGEFTAELKGGKVDVQEGLLGEAKCKVTASSSTFLDIIAGKKNAQLAFLSGAIKISNLGEMLKYAKVFGLMK